MSKSKTRVLIIYIDSEQNCSCMYDKILDSEIDYYIEMPLLMCVEKICKDSKAGKVIYCTNDGTAGIYKLPNNLGLLIQIFSEEF